ncbi:MAG TPA: hypothetical protein VFF69_09650 [Phycisphaerales bacterium]|nr:hypothetical protein [Phycisphaerales bacterium]
MLGVLIAGGLVGAGAAASGCASAARARTTRLASADLDQAVLEIRDSLASSRFIAERGPASAEARLVLRRVENLSTDRIPVAEQWSLASRVIAHEGMQELLRSKNVVVQLPPEKVTLLGRGGLEFPALGPEDRPTHVMRAQIASGTRAASLAGGRRADIRKEYYLISFAIEDLQGREVLWQGDAELAREAQGSLVD